MSVAGSILLSSGSRVSCAAIGLATAMLVARALGPEGRGHLGVVVAFFSVLGGCATMGFGDAGILIAGNGSRSRREVFGQTARWGLLLALVGTAAGALVLWRCSAILLPGMAPAYAQIGLAMVPAIVLYELLAKHLLAIHAFRRYAAAEVVRSSCVLLSTAALLYVLRLGVRGAIAANLLGYASVIAIVVVSRSGCGPASRTLDLGYGAAAFTRGLPIHLANCVLILQARADVLLVSWVLTARAVGLYAVAVSLAEKLVLLSEAAATVLFPICASRRGTASAEQLCPLLLRSVLVFSLLTACAVVPLSSFIVRLLFSSAFAEAALPFQLLAIGAIFRSGWNVLESELRGRGQASTAFALTSAGVALAAVLIAVFSRVFGLAGAACAVLVSHAVLFAAGLRFYCGAARLGVSAVLVPRADDWGRWVGLFRSP